MAEALVPRLRVAPPLLDEVVREALVQPLLLRVPLLPPALLLARTFLRKSQPRGPLRPPLLPLVDEVARVPLLLPTLLLRRVLRRHQPLRNVLRSNRLAPTPTAASWSRMTRLPAWSAGAFPVARLSAAEPLLPVVAWCSKPRAAPSMPIRPTKGKSCWN